MARLARKQILGKLFQIKDRPDQIIPIDVKLPCLLQTVPS